MASRERSPIDWRSGNGGITREWEPGPVTTPVSVTTGSILVVRGDFLGRKTRVTFGQRERDAIYSPLPVTPGGSPGSRRRIGPQARGPVTPGTTRPTVRSPTEPRFGRRPRSPSRPPRGDAAVPAGADADTGHGCDPRVLPLVSGRPPKPSPQALVCRVRWRRRVRHRGLLLRRLARRSVAAGPDLQVEHDECLGVGRKTCLP